MAEVGNLDICLIELFVCELVFLSLPSYMIYGDIYRVEYFYINNILIMIEIVILEFYIGAL